MNKGKRWTNDENNILIDYILNNNINLLDNISIQLGRTKYAIIKQLEKLLFQQNININEIYEDVLISNIKKSFPISNIKKSFPKDNSDLINLADKVKDLYKNPEVANYIHNGKKRSNKKFSSYKIRTKI